MVPSIASGSNGPDHLRFVNCDNFTLASEIYLELYDKDINWNPTQTTHLFTDGACKGNGQVGAKAGYGIYFQDGPLKGLKVSSYLPESTYDGVKMKQTNNRAEILAVIDGLEIYFSHRCIGDLIVVVDNELTMNIANKWIDDWAKYDKIKERKNPDLLYRYKKILDSIRSMQKGLKYKFQIIWTKSHLKKDEIPKKKTKEYKYYIGNEEADRLANIGVQLSEKRVRQITY